MTNPPFEKDTVQRQLAEAALRNTMERLDTLRGIINRGPAVVFLWRVAPGWPVEYVSENVRQFGYEPRDFLSGKVSWVGVTHPEDVQRLEDEVSRYIRDGTQEFTQHYRLLNAEGEPRWVEDRTIAIHDEAGNLTHFQGIIWDVTERETAEAQRRRLNQELEDRVAERTRDLEAANAALRAEIETRCRVEEELFSSRQMLQLVLDHIPQRVFWKGRDLKYLGCNRPFAQDAGVESPDGLIGKDDFQLSWAANAEDCRADDRSVIDSGRPKLNFEEPQAMSDGSRMWLRTSKVPLRDRSGAVFALMGTYEDVTERRRQEALRQESEHRFRALFDAAPLGILIHRQGHALFANPAFLRMFGYAGTDEVRGRPVADFVTPAFREQAMEFARRRMRGEPVPTEYEIDGQRKDDSAFPMRCQGTTVQLEDGLAIVVFLTDISEGRRMEKALRESEAKYRRLAESASDPIFVFDRGFRLTYVNRPGAARFEGEPEGVVGKTLGELFPPSTAAGQLERLRRVVESGQELKGEHVTKFPSGEEVWYDTLLSPIKDESGAVVGVMGIARDVTERRRADAERERLLNELQKASEQIKTLSGLIPICAHCKKIRDDKGYWSQLEIYLIEHAKARFSHGLCPECARALYPELKL